MLSEQQQVLIPWTPSDDPNPSAITPRTVHRFVSAKYEDTAANQRTALHRLRDRLQAAMFAGSHTDVVERSTADEDVLLREFEANKELSFADHRDFSHAGGGDSLVLGKCNVATASLLYRQFEMISRRGVAVEETEERQALMLHYWAQSRVMLSMEKNRAHRSLISGLDDLQRTSVGYFSWCCDAIRQLEASSRRLLESCADDDLIRIDHERRALLESIRLGHKIAREQRLQQQEENARHLLSIEFEKGMSQLFVSEMNDAHSTQLELLIKASRAEQLRDASQARRAALLEPPDSSDSEEATSSSSLVEAFSHFQRPRDLDGSHVEATTRSVPPIDMSSRPKKPQGREKRQPPSKSAAKKDSMHVEKQRPPVGLSCSVPADMAPSVVTPRQSPSAAQKQSGNIVVPPPPAAGLPPQSLRPQFMIDADVESASDDPNDAIRSELLSHRQQLTNLTRFQQCYGWMLKSTGVFMTWQKRFFALTSKGKLRYTTSEPQAQAQQRWMTLLNAEDIVRVELDTTCGSKPPIDQYHQYGFYVDVAHLEGPKDIRPRRIRFCCFHRSDLQMWLAALRHATDVVFALEERGDLPRSPLRRLLDPVVLTALLDSEPVKHYSLRSPVPQTYRLRMQTESEVAAIEEHLKEVDAAAKAKQHEKELAAALRSYSPTRFDA